MRLSSAQLAGASDEALIGATRAGDSRAYAELWRRHSTAALMAARSVTHREDPDDLVSEAFTRILQAIREGRGPSAAFRPYLLVTVKNIAVSRSRLHRDTNLDDAEEVADPTLTEATAIAAFEKSAVATAYKTLPKRWQQVLWYSEVENMSSDDIGLVLGVAVQNVPTLAYRAREGLRQAWIQAHVSVNAPTGDHRWVVEQLGRYTRGAVTESRRIRIDAHLAECRDCAEKAREAGNVGSMMALTLLGLILGGGAATYATWSGVGAASASASTIALGSGAAVPGHSGVFDRFTDWAKSSPATAAGVTVAVVVATVAAVAATATVISLSTGAATLSEAQPTSAPSSAHVVHPPASSATTPGTPGTDDVASSPSAGGNAARVGASARGSSSSPASPAGAVSNTVAAVDTLGGALNPTFRGTAAAGTVVYISIDGGAAQSFTAASDNTWVSSQMSISGAGDHTATITFTSPNGIHTVQTTRFSIAVPVATLSFPVDSFAALTVTVAGAPNTTYHVLVNGAEWSRTTVSGSGQPVSAQLPTRAWDSLATASITLRAVDGQRFGPSISLGLPAAVPTITSVDTGGGAFYPVVTGHAPTGATVTVTPSGSSPVTVVADSSGVWTTEQLTGVTTGAPATVVARMGTGAGAVSPAFTVQNAAVRLPSTSDSTYLYRNIDGLVPLTRYVVTGSPTCTAFPDGTNSQTVLADSGGKILNLAFNICQNQSAPTLRAVSPTGNRTGPLFTLW